MSKIEKITEELYEEYSKAVGGVAFNGDLLPKWKEFAGDIKKGKQVNAWRQVARKACELFEIRLSDVQ